MKNLLAIFIFLSLLPFGVIGQPNLVQNGNFEFYNSCPNALSQGSNCSGWQTWINSTPDYFHACTSIWLIDVPTNNFGYQQAHSGNAYVGVYSYPGANPYKEYLTRTMSSMMRGASYSVSLSVSLANSSNMGTNDIGVHFYDAGPTYHSIVTGIPATPQVEWPAQVITDTQNWVRLTKTFVADSAYDNIAIGCFRDSSNITTIGSSSGFAYYYIDSVVVKFLDSINFIFNDTLLCSGNASQVQFVVARKKQSNNVFTVQLSNSTGSFASPVNIGTLNSDTSGTINLTIPSNTPTGTGYKIRIIASNIADTSDVSLDIKIGNAPIAKPVAANNGPICTSNVIQLTATSATSGVSYSWTGPNNFVSNLQNPKIYSATAAHVGNYIVTSRLYGCFAKDTTTVSVISATGPVGVNATSNTPCDGDTLKLFGTASGSGITYSWTGPNGFTSNLQNPIIAATTAAAAGPYILYAYNGTCTTMDTINVVIKPLAANVSVAYTNPACQGETIFFSGFTTSTGVTWKWTGPNGFNSNSPNPFITGASTVHNGNYVLTVTLNQCPITDTVSITVKPTPVTPVANSNIPCVGQTLNLTASTTTTGVAWSWTGPNSFSSTSQNPNIANSTLNMSGDYIVIANLAGCIKKDTATVFIRPLPVSVTLSNNSPICAGDTLKIFSTASSTGVSYVWAGPNSFTAATQNSSIAGSTTAATGWYKMTVDLNGCTYTDSTNATVKPIPAIPVASYNNPLCVGETLNLTTSNVTGASYSWTGANSFSSTQQNPTRTGMQFGDTGTYSVTTTLNGCTSPAGNVSVKINPVPFVVIFSNPADSICNGAPVLFTALPNNHGGTPAYQWYVNMQPATTGVVFSTSTLNNGDIIRCDMTENTKCSVPYKDESNDIQMTVLPWLAPSVSISANPTTPLKENEYVTFTATPTNAGIFPKYQWKRNGLNVVGATSYVWSANTLNDNDEICVEITSTYKCPQPLTGMSNCIKVKVLTGVEEIDADNRMVLYPNPNNGRFILKGQLRQGTHLQIEIVNALGQVVYSEELAPVNGVLHNEIKPGNVAAGVYMLRVHMDGGVNLFRFSVNN